ncbi:MAG: DUF1326 domain-containing protein [Phycisphaerae bacterium]
MKRTALALLVGMLAGTPMVARATPDITAVAAAGGLGAHAIRDANSLETREFHIHNARLPGSFSAHQEVTAWQVTQGTWNGQSLAGLCLVLVHSISDDGRSPSYTNCYVSDFATSAQRQALLTAFQATNPKSIPAGEASSLHVEPAVITLEVEGQALTLHLGLVA